MKLSSNKEFTKVVAATLLCDRKASSQLVFLPSVLEMEGLDYLYINIQTSLSGEAFKQTYATLTNAIFRYNQVDGRVKICTDIWSWKPAWQDAIPTYDQDQRRLYHIVQARMMCRTFALAFGASHLLFIDADVIPSPTGLTKLLAMRKPVVGGFVPGRGVHSQYWYVFHDESLTEDDKKHFGEDAPNIVRCAHGTCGYLLIERQVFSEIGFRFGASREDHKTPLSEDPAFASDAFLAGFGRWYINKTVRADHWDDPQNPMTEEGVSKDFQIPV